MVLNFSGVSYEKEHFAAQPSDVEVWFHEMAAFIVTNFIAFALVYISCMVKTRWDGTRMFG